MEQTQNFICIIAGLPEDCYDDGIRFGRYNGFLDKAAVELFIGGEMDLLDSEDEDDNWNPAAQSLEEYLQGQHDQTRVRVSTFLDEGYECEPKLGEGSVIEGGPSKRYGIECKLAGEVQCVWGNCAGNVGLVYALIEMLKENGEYEDYKEALAGYTFEATHITLLGNQGMKWEYKFVEVWSNLLINVQLELDQEFVNDVLITAFEGGIGYWCRSMEELSGNRGKDALKPDYFAPAGFEWRFQDEDKNWIEKTLTIDTFIEGIEKFLGRADSKITTDEPGKLYAGDIDANDADSIVQLAIFGDYVYG